MVQHLAFSVSHHKAESLSLSRGTNEFLDKSKQNQPEWDVRLVLYVFIEDDKNNFFNSQRS